VERPEQGAGGGDPSGGGEPSQYQEEQRRGDGVKQDTCEVVAGGVLTPQLNVGFVAEPRQGMPIEVGYGGKGEGDAGGRHGACQAL
jgi:hypothetical protein